LDNGWEDERIGNDGLDNSVSLWHSGCYCYCLVFVKYL